MSLNQDQVERRIDKIAGRSWDVIRDAWLPFIPNINPPGDPPPALVQEVPGFIDLARIALKDTGVSRHVDSDVFLRRATFWEGIYLLHKARHIIGAGGNHVTEGLCSWSISSFYQALLFCIKGIIQLLGVALPEVDSGTVIVDLWPEESTQQTKSRKKGLVVQPEYNLIGLRSRIEHHAAWYTLLRLLRISKVNVWPKDFVEGLTNLQIGHISDQRNALHYRTAHWPLPDLYTPSSQLRFARNLQPGEFPNLDPKSDEFTLHLAHTVLRMGVLLIEDLAELSALVDSEFTLMKRCLVGSPHLYYTSLFP